MLEIAQDKANVAGVENITFVRSSIDEFSLDDQSLDVVMALSILHLLEDRNSAIAKVYQLLRPGGVFVTSTICLGDSMLKYLAVIARLGRPFGLMPLLKTFSATDLIASFAAAGFEIDHEWQPGNSKAVFVVAKKPSS